MLLRFFRINDPYRMLAILVILILVCLPLLIDPAAFTIWELKSVVLGELLNQGNSLYSEVQTDMPPLAGWIFGWLDGLFGRSVTGRHLLALVLIFLQGSFFAVLLINNKAHNESTYLPGLIFCLLSVFSFDLFSLSQELLASTVLLFALNNLFKEIEFRIQRDSIILNLGLYVGIASMLVFSYWIFLPGVLIILIIFTRLTIRKGLLLAFGFFFPHALMLVIYYLGGNHHALITDYYLANLQFEKEFLMSFLSIVLLGGVPLLYFFFALVMLNREARLTKYQSQLLQVMLLWVALAIIEILVSRELRPGKFITFIPSFAYFISHYILLIRRKWLGDLTLWIFIAGLVLSLYLARYDKLKYAEYGTLFPKKSPYDAAIKDKSVLILGDDWGLYEANRGGSFFLDWELSKPVFTNTDYFENVLLIRHSFEKEYPQVIIDKENLMPGVFYRIPGLEKNYSRENEIYVLKGSK